MRGPMRRRASRTGMQAARPHAPHQTDCCMCTLLLDTLCSTLAVACQGFAGGDASREGQGRACCRRSCAPRGLRAHGGSVW